MKIAVIGDGGWGTTLAILLSKKGFDVTLWGAFPEYVLTLDKKRANPRFLPGIKIPKNIRITSDLGEASKGKDIIVMAVPSLYMRSILKALKKTDYPRRAIYLSVTKGIEINTLKTMSEIIRQELGKLNVAVLSGPTIAHEVAKNIPTTAVIASKSTQTRKFLQDVFMTGYFRVYTNNDVSGVELGGCLKNVIAIACGISDGLGFGTNTKAAILSRGLAEISRLGKVMGANPKTFSGISGLGDLVTTCISKYSRNRCVGEKIGKGQTLLHIKSGMQMVAEGVPTAKSAYQLSLKYKVPMPITKEVYSVLYKNKSPLTAVKDLMKREKKEE
ncbi:MAG: NAD(P)-dependent glycerol-3-phosphate dehydrogenase [Candidatus Omnitrophica bacterium]|nr:NAD(P)-dependent glycerol-3-phosphate dehydrogenase [Candidatus Omnitrophota bacterium]